MATVHSTPARSRRRVRIGLRSAGMLMTPEEFDATPEWAWDDRYKYELIRGVLVVVPPVGGSEADPNEELGYMLRKYQKSHANGSVIDVTMPERYVPGTDQRRRCDRAVWVGLGRQPDLDNDVPAIAIEFVSSSKSRRPPRLRDETRRISRLGSSRILDH